MTKTICLARHSEYDMQPAEQITPEGVKQARRSAMQLGLLGISPCIIFSSPAPRALQTAQEYKNALDPDEVRGLSIVEHKAFIEVRTSQEAEIMLKAIGGFDDVYKTILIVSHQPVANVFASALGYRITGKMSNADILVAPFPVERWQDIGVVNSPLSGMGFIVQPAYQDIRHLRASRDAAEALHKNKKGKVGLPIIG